MKMSVWSLNCQHSVFRRYHREKHLSEFCPQDGGESVEIASPSRYAYPRRTQTPPPPPCYHARIAPMHFDAAFITYKQPLLLTVPPTPSVYVPFRPWWRSYATNRSTMGVYVPTARSCVVACASSLLFNVHFPRNRLSWLVSAFELRTLNKWNNHS